MGNNEPPSLKKYKNVLNEFYEYVKRFHSESNNIDKLKEGYFVNLYYYNELINQINKEDDEKKKNPNQNNINDNKGEVNFTKLKTVALKEVDEKIKTDYSFIIINEDLFKLICDQENQPIYKITYKITTENKLLVQENGLQFQYRNNKNNIISKEAILGIIGNNNINSSQVSQNNYENKLYESIKIYVENERYILTNLKTNSENIYQGFLVDSSWVDKWKTYSNYNNVSKLFQTNNINEAEIKNNIRQELLNNKLNFSDLDYIDKFILNDVTQLKTPITANKTYVLLTNKFINLFINTQGNNINPTNFYLSFQKINIKINNILFLSFQTNSNVIFNSATNYSGNNSIPKQISPNIIPTNTLYQSEFLMHLIRLPFFKKELKASSYSAQNNLNKAYIINKEIINNLKQNYELKKVINQFLNHILNNVNYRNAVQYYPQISKILNEKNFEYINNIKQLETTGAIQFNENEKKLDCKYLYNNQLRLLYIDNIEIIDEHFALFLKKKFNNSLMMLPIYNVAIEEKILLIIDVNQTFIYEIVSFSPNGGDMIVEYVIEIQCGQIFEKKELARYIVIILAKNGIQKLLLNRNSIPIGNNIFITFHQIKNNSLENSFNIENKKNEINKNIYPINNNNILQSQAMNQSPNANQIYKNNLFKSLYFDYLSTI